MSSVITTLINEARTPEDYEQACLVMQQHIRSGHATFEDMHHLAIKGHVIAATTGQPVSVAFQRTYSTEPEVTWTSESERQEDAWQASTDLWIQRQLQRRPE